MPLKELISYVELDERDEARLRALHPTLEPLFPAIAEEFYRAVWKNPGAAAMLSGPAQVERLRVTLIDWMSTGLLGPYDDRFYEKRSRIGRRHVKIGLAQQYMFTAMNVVRIAYQDHIARLFAPDEAAANLRSVHKLLDIELAIMLRHYQLDSEDKLIARERSTIADRLTAMQTMTAGIAHEVRNPLNSARLQLELLERRLRKRADDERLVEPCELAQKEIERLTLLLNDFLSFARPPELHLTSHDVAQIASHIYELEKAPAAQKEVSLVLESPVTKLPASIDAAKVHQIILNLVRNAVEAVSAGGHVYLGVDGDSSTIRLWVRDDGPGIPEATRARIYEPFFSTKEGGTGLGMSIVHSLVLLHGGTITLDTGPKGTRFDISLPRRI